MIRFMIRVFLLLIVILGQAFFCQAASYYVDKDATGKNDGSSWTNAWKGFSHIQWSSISPGDTIFISGGASSKTYNESLVVQASGAEGLPVLITKGQDPGHNGEVVIDGGGSLEVLVGLENVNYVTVSDLTLKNLGSSCGECGRAVDIDECSHVIVENMTIEVAARAGVFIEESQDCVIGNNRIETVDYVEQQTDGIYSQRNARNIYEGNTIIINNRYEDGHNDAIQSYMDDSLTIRNNYAEQNNTKTVNAQGIFCTTLSGTFEIYNNVVYAPNTYNSLIALKIPSPSFHAVIVSNTLIGSKWGSIKVEGDDYAVIKNNIAWDYNGGEALTYSGDMQDVTNNLFDADPMLDSNFMPKEGSPVLNAGASLPAPYDIDKAGNARPQGAAFDIGAYEKVVEEIPSPPKNLRIIQ